MYFNTVYKPSVFEFKLLNENIKYIIIIIVIKTIKQRKLEAVKAVLLNVKFVVLMLVL